MAILVRNISTHTVEVELPGCRCLRLAPQEECEVESTDCRSPVFRRLVNRSVLEEFTSEQVLKLKKKAKSNRRKLLNQIAKTRRESEKKAREAKEKEKKVKSKDDKKRSPQKKKTGAKKKTDSRRKTSATRRGIKE